MPEDTSPENQQAAADQQALTAAQTGTVTPDQGQPTSDLSPTTAQATDTGATSQVSIDAADTADHAPIAPTDEPQILTADDGLGADGPDADGLDEEDADPETHLQKLEDLIHHVAYEVRDDFRALIAKIREAI